MASEIGRKFRAERRRRGQSQAQFARAIGTPLSSYQKIEQLDRMPANAAYLFLALKWLKHERETWFK